eukprot:COSAG02_NODE_491_length_21224_cov_5.973680_14_plen_40_part_00
MLLLQVELDGTRVSVTGEYDIHITNGVDTSVSVPISVIA